MPPPTTAPLPSGEMLELVPLAAAISRTQLERHPEVVERYGEELAEAWCTHDNQHILAWAVGDLDLQGQLAWLARILGSRGYAVQNLIDNVATAAAIVEREVPEPAGSIVARRLREAAAGLGSAG